MRWQWADLAIVSVLESKMSALPSRFLISPNKGIRIKFFWIKFCKNKMHNRRCMQQQQNFEWFFKNGCRLVTFHGPSDQWHFCSHWRKFPGICAFFRFSPPMFYQFCCQKDSSHLIASQLWWVSYFAGGHDVSWWQDGNLLRHTKLYSPGNSKRTSIW